MRECVYINREASQTHGRNKLCINTFKAHFSILYKKGDILKLKNVNHIV